MNYKRYVMAGLVAFQFASAASAAVIIDKSPDTLGNPEFFQASDYNHNQNFLVQLTLASTTTLTAFDNYSSYPVGVGEGVVIKIRNDIAGLPAPINLFRYENTVSHVDSIGAFSTTPMSRRHADFTPTTLAAGTYWIGMSGTSELSWSSYDVGYFSPAGQVAVGRRRPAESTGNRSARLSHL